MKALFAAVLLVAPLQAFATDFLCQASQDSSRKDKPWALKQVTDSTYQLYTLNTIYSDNSTVEVDGEIAKAYTTGTDDYALMGVENGILQLRDSFGSKIALMGTYGYRRFMINLDTGEGSFEVSAKSHLIPEFNVPNAAFPRLDGKPEVEPLVCKALQSPIKHLDK